ncbi:MAG: GerMN domain-containing protein [Deltaproteobacteria bacterium]|nr:GerMN domain-containing protein [Deltaproteobacteria bacterium]
MISPRPERLPTKHPPPPVSPLPVKKTSARIGLYFSDPQSDFLAKEVRTVMWNRGDPKDQIDVIVNELIKGPQGNLQQTIPSNVRLRNIVIKKKGVGVIDLSKELSQNHPGGTLAEMHTIYSLVNSLLLNIASLKQVQILVEGQAPETLKGHIDCRTPFDLNRSIIKSG